jgi:hypothetical protein
MHGCDDDSDSGSDRDDNNNDNDRDDDDNGADDNDDNKQATAHMGRDRLHGADTGGRFLDGRNAGTRRGNGGRCR